MIDESVIAAMTSVFWRVPLLKDLECIRVSGSRHSFPRHFHETYVVEVVEKGINEFWLNGQTYAAVTGDMIIIQPGEIHTGYPSGSQELCYRSVYPSKRLIRELTRASENVLPCFNVPVVNDPPLARRLCKAHMLLQTEPSGADGIFAMTEALSELIRRHASIRSLFQNVDAVESFAIQLRPVFSQKRIERVLELLANRYIENVSLAELSEFCGLSEYHFLRTFKKFTGLAPYEYVIANRVEQCKRFLSRGMSISEAAARTGFFDQSHLHRHFKRLVGITPGQYTMRSARSYARSS